MVLVLLVDDDSTTLSENADALLSAGHQVCTASNGEEALDELIWNCPDVMVCDSNMPVVDGWDLVRQVRADERYLALRIIFMGSADDKELRLAAYRCGVDEYLPKPFEPEELARRLDRALVRSSVQGLGQAPAREFDFQGRLEHLALLAVLGLLKAEAKTGVLQIQNAGLTLNLGFERGELKSARSESEAHLSFEACFSKALSLHSGEFRFVEQRIETHPDSRVSDRTVSAQVADCGRINAPKSASR